MKISWSKEKAWQVDVTIAGKRIRETGFDRKSDAEDFVVELRMKAKRSRFGLESERPRITVAELVQEHSSDIDKTRPRGRQMGKILKSFLASLPADLELGDLRTAHFREWLKDLKRNGLGRGPLGPASCNRYLAEISVMLKAAPAIFV